MLRDREREALNLASQGKWEGAVEANRDILAQQPNNAEALNRLSKALSSLGRYSEARKTLQKVLLVQPSNAIAKKNLERIQGLKDTPQGKGTTAGLAPRLFVEESGKTATTTLLSPAGPSVLAKVAAGDTVELGDVSKSPEVRIPGDGALGRLNPKIAARLARLVKSGNKYVVAVARVSDRQISVLIRETYKHPSMVDVVSFPSSAEGMAYADVDGGEEDLREAEPEAGGDEPETEEAEPVGAPERDEAEVTPARAKRSRPSDDDDDDDDEDEE